MTPTATSLAIPRIRRWGGITAPPHLNKAERALFIELVGCCDPRHFVKSDLPLLTSFVQATLLARSTAPKPGRNKNDLDAVAAWEKAVRVMALLATRLRLAPQARSDPKTVGTRQRNAELGVAPWRRKGTGNDQL